jgi:cysteine desulfurase
MIYLDNSATTPMAPEVIARMEEVRRDVFANASSVHRGGQRARVEIEEARERIAAMLGAEPKEIIFTSGGTEANNYGLKGFAQKMVLERGVWPTIVTARSEHHAVLHPAEFLARLGAELRFVDVDAEGRTHPEKLRATLETIDRSRPLLVAIMHANNETGTINPVAALADVTHEHGGVILSDAVQTFGKISMDAVLGADMITISAHKIHGPKGVGAIRVRKEIEIESLLHGGAQERNRRGGTESPELIAGMDEAATLASATMIESGERIEMLSRRLRELLTERIEGVRFVTSDAGTLPNIVNVTFQDAERLDGEALIVGMDLRGVAVSNGSACTSGSLQPSHVLLAMGLPTAQAKAAVRFSLGRYTTDEEIDLAATALADVVETMRTNNSRFKTQL